MKGLSVIILTKNEELIIQRCINQIDFAEEILVFDSESIDRTVEIARACGARVVTQAWLGWSQQRNLAAKTAQNDWVLFLDADDLITPPLRESLIKLSLSEIDPKDAFYVHRRGDFLGILLPQSSRKPDIVGTRLFNKKFSRYDEEMLVHEEVRVPGKRHKLNGDLLHWRSYKIEDYARIFNAYSSLEKEALLRKNVSSSFLQILLRPLLRFAWHYFVKREFLLGTRGLIHCGLKAYTDFLRYAKLWEDQKKISHDNFKKFL